MSKVCFFSYPAYGHINMTLGLVKKLVERGEEVLYYTGQNFKKTIESTGAAFRRYIIEKDGYTIETYIDDILRKFESINKKQPSKLSCGFETYLASGVELFNFNILIEKSMVNEIIHENPDYIIHDSCVSAGKKLAKMLHIPAITSVSNFIFKEKMLDIDLSVFCRNILRTVDTTPDMKDKYRLTIRYINMMARKVKEVYHLETPVDFLDLFASEEELNLVYTSEYFQPYRAVFCNNYKFVGPIIDSAGDNSDFPYKGTSNRPLIYISLGTLFNNCTAFYRKCIEAFKSENVQVIMSAGNTIRMEELGSIPDNIIIKPYVPQLQVLRHAQLFITHGGTNSINEALYFCIPLLVIPHAVMEHFFMAEQVEKLNAGIYVKSLDVTAVELRKYANRILSDNSYRQNIKLIANSFKESGGSSKAVEEIFSFKKLKDIIK